MTATPIQEEWTRTALERLLRIAQGHTGQSRRVADFLLAWWNAEECGGFDLTDTWTVDGDIAADMVTVFAFLVMRRQYPDTLGYGQQFAALVHAWRPALTNGQ
jgi:hypothetical protein